LVARANQASVLTELGDLAAGIHHDIATPMAVIDAEMSRLAAHRISDPLTSTFIKNMAAPLAQIEGARRVVDLARLPDEEVQREFTRINAKATVNRAIKMHRGKFTISPMEINNNVPERYYFYGNTHLASEAFVNILNNAHEAGADRLVVSGLKDSDDKLTIIFRNNGRELTAEEIANAKKAGWSRKSLSPGRANVGMGLFMTNKILRMHRAQLTLRRSEEPGARTEVVVCMDAARGR
jgi:signal transduction histidine kinase